MGYLWVKLHLEEGEFQEHPQLYNSMPGIGKIVLIKENDGIHINWPNTFVRGRWWMGESDDLKPNKSYKQVEALSQFIISAKAHNTKPTSSHLPFEAMKSVLINLVVYFSCQ